MKVSIDRQKNGKAPSQVNFKGYDIEKSKAGDLVYTFNFPYDKDKYNGYVEICLLKKDNNGNYHIVDGLINKDIDVSNIEGETQKNIAAMALPLNDGKTTINLSKSYGIPVNTPFGYHFKLVPKNGNSPIYQIDSGDVIDFSQGVGYSHDVYNIITPNGTKGTEIGSQILLIPDSYNAMYTYDKDGKVIPNLKYMEAIKATKHFSNKMGGSLAGVEHDLDAGKFDNYTKIISTPLFTDDSLTPHNYWNKNCMQMAHSLGNIKNYQSLQKKLFAKGINWVSDGAFVNEGLEGVHFRHVLKWGEKSPYFNWFRASNLKDKPLILGVFPKNHEVIGFKVVNSPEIVTTDKNGVVTGVTKNKNYDSKQPTYIQIFDNRLVTADEAKDNSPLIKSYSKLDTGNTFDIVTHQDTLPPYSFEVDPDTLTKNMKTLATYNKDVKDSGKLTKDSYQAIRLLSRFENFTLDEKIEGGFDTWDANVDIAKINYVYSKENIKELHNIMNDDDRIEYNRLITKNNFMTQDYALTSAAYWTKMTNGILNLHVAQNLKNVDTKDAGKIMEQIKTNVVDKRVFPQKVMEAVDEDVINYILKKKYDLNEKSNEEYKNVIISGMMDLPLDSIELGDNIVSVLASPYMSKRATTADDLGISRFDLLQKDENSNLDDKFKKTYNETTELYEKQMYDFASEILAALNKKLPAQNQLNDGLNTSEYGKYVMSYITAEIAKFAIIKGLFPNAEVKIDETNGGVIYDYNKLKQTSLQELGINANSPVQEAELLLKRLKGSKFIKSGIPAISDKDKAILVDALYKMLEGTNTMSFKLAEVIVDRSKSGLDWRIDATKDIADVESLRNEQTDFEDTWGNIINFWSKFAKSVYKYNPNSYLVAEVTDEMTMYGKAGNKSPKYTYPKDVVMKFLRETGITSTANYSFFFTDIPALFGKNIEKGEDWGVDHTKVYTLLKDFLFSGPLHSIISSYTFGDNHDKPRLLHGLAMDMGLFYADLNKSLKADQVNTQDYKYKETAYKVTHGMFFPGDGVETYKILNYDFTRISPKAIAMGDAMGNAFGNALQTLTGGPEKKWERFISDEQQNMAYKALAAAVADLSKGIYDGNVFQAEAFGVRPFDIAIEMVVNQAVKYHGLKFSDNAKENAELIKRLKNTMFYEALAPAMTKVQGIMKTLVALPGAPTLFAGDDMGSTGYEQLTKNIYLQNRSTLHWEWLEEDSPEHLEFIQEHQKKLDEIMATRKRPELHPLNDGAPYLLNTIQVNNQDNKVNALLRQSTDGSMTISLFNMSGANHNFRQKNEPENYPVHIDAIELNRINQNDKYDSGLRCGLPLGTEFIDAKNPNDVYVVVNGNDPDHYKIVKKGGGTIYIDDNTKILYYVSPEFQKKKQRIEALRNAMSARAKLDKPQEGTYKNILDLRRKQKTAKQTAFSGRQTRRRELYNPQYNFRAANAYVQQKETEKGSKLSLISK
ncbi:hypothetical protein IAC76_04885 [Spirochaetes bacterium]|uniref:Glycosyl hydrolase family 13 catalytic domain-containing protein n=1 Tax=Candidatus Scatousia excrementipullorum TaxID=2840936 RepID=A0A9D9H0Q6_9BACT|nr:hypothetical protein [Candidatus Scatousia excrementipullorum]